MRSFRSTPAVVFRAVVALIIALSVLVTGVGSVASHSSLSAAVPAVGLLSGPFNEVRLQFIDPIKDGADINIDLRDSEGLLLDGYLSETELVDEFTIRADVLQELPGEGQYLVFFMIENDDGDGIQEAGYEFFFDPTAAGAVLTANNQGASGLQLVGLGVSLFAFILLLLWFSPWWPGRKEETAGNSGSGTAAGAGL